MNPNRPPSRKTLSLPSRQPAATPSSSAAASPPGTGERLQKLLAAAGFGSRREIETWITAGRVSVRGQVAKLGDRAAPGEEILLDGKPIKTAATKGLARVLLYHKPVGELVTRSDPENRPTVFAKLPPISPGRWVNVGRLDFNTSGLLLFTDSGELANQLMHPRHEIEREYEVRVQGGLGPEAVRKLLNGVQLEDGDARFLRLEPIQGRKDAGTNKWYRAVLAEGRNREVRRMIEAADARVSRLIRVRFGAILLPLDLSAGRWIELDAGKIKLLLNDMKGRP
jgi:23S rRNA pseudouridine2605 synthase